MRPPDLSTIIPEALVKQVRSESPQAEIQGGLTRLQLSIMRDQGWFRLLIPRSIGGLEYDLPDLLSLQEAASWMDGSFGWVLALCGGAGFFAGFVEQSVSEEIFGRPDVCAAGTGFPAGWAEQVPGGYKVSGHWRYASGAPHATVYTANCRLIHEGTAVIRAVILQPEQVALKDGWQSLGLKATASQDMVVSEAFVPSDRTFTLDQPFPHAQGPLYHYPFLQQAEAVLSVTLLGMTRHFLDLFAHRILPKFEGDSKAILSGILVETSADLEHTREAFYGAVARSWEPYLQQSVAGEAELIGVGGAAREAARTALRCSDRLYPYGGMEMMQVEAEINRVWRDIHTASQHILLAPLGRGA